MNNCDRRSARVACAGGGGAAVGGLRRTTFRVLPLFVLLDDLVGDGGAKWCALLGSDELPGSRPSTGRWRTIFLARSEPVNCRTLSALRLMSISRDLRGLDDVDAGKNRVFDFGIRTTVSNSSAGDTVEVDADDEATPFRMSSSSAEGRRLTSLAPPSESRSM